MPRARDRIEYPIGHALYQSKGWISHLRFSPQGDKIAFMDHPALWDDRGSVSLMDLSGHVTVLSAEWESEDGLAWSPDGKEVWFTAVEKGINRDLLAVNMSGRIRKILDLPAGMTLEDVAPDGRVLVSLDDERLAMATAARDGKAVDISWHDWNIAKDISRDGQSVLFEDSSEAAGTHYALAIRKLDGTPPVQLGEGSGGRSFSGRQMGDFHSHRQPGTGDAGSHRSRSTSHDCHTWAGADFTTAMFISWQMGNTSPSTPTNPATARAAIWWIWRGENQYRSRRKGLPAG